MDWQEPVPSIKAHPSASSLLVWHYVLEGPKGCEYEGGYYWGKVEFPSDCMHLRPATLCEHVCFTAICTRSCMTNICKLNFLRVLRHPCVFGILQH